MSTQSHDSRDQGQGQDNILHAGNKAASVMSLKSKRARIDEIVLETNTWSAASLIVFAALCMKDGGFVYTHNFSATRLDKYTLRAAVDDLTALRSIARPSTLRIWLKVGSRRIPRNSMAEIADFVISALELDSAARLTILDRDSITIQMVRLVHGATLRNNVRKLNAALAPKGTGP